MSKIISIDDIQEGMINQEPIVNRYGQTLLAPGIKLSLQHTMILKTWNIRTIKVSGGEDEEESDINDELKELIMEKLKKRAKWVPRNPIEEDMIQMAVIHLAKEYTHKDE